MKAKKFLWILGWIWVVMTASHASTVLISHHGSTLPTTEGWALVGSNSNVTASAAQVNGRNVWRIEDPGVINGTNGKTAGLYYENLLDEAPRNQAHSLGWSISASLNLPTDYPTTGISWGADSSTWIGYAYDFPNTSAPSIERRVFAMMFGRTTAGKTQIKLYTSTGTISRDLDPGFHDYRMDFNPITQLVSVYIDNEYWIDHEGHKSTTTAAGKSRLYWGDNSNQSNPGAWRAADYESVVMSIVPEPHMGALALLGMSLCLMRRKRGTC